MGDSGRGVSERRVGVKEGRERGGGWERRRDCEREREERRRVDKGYTIQHAGTNKNREEEERTAREESGEGGGMRVRERGRSIKRGECK